jgi:flagellar biosynthesis protein
MSEKQRKAAALKYRHMIDRAPTVLAKGQGVVAERIIGVARKHGIQMKKDPALVEVLAKLDVGDEIPQDLYRAVAEVLAYVYRMTKKI